MTGGGVFGHGQWAADPFSLEEVDDTDSTGWLPTGIGSLKSALRRRSRVWLAAGALGLVLGAVFHVIVPTKYAAVTELYLVEPSAQAMSDDVALLQTRAVADRATAQIRNGAGSHPVAFSYRGVPLSPSVLQIKVSAPSPSDAIAISQALAPAFLQERASVLNQQTQAVIARTQAQIAALNADVANLDSQISDLHSSTSGPDVSQQASLVNQRDGEIAQRTRLQNAVQQSLNSEVSLSQGSRVLNPPRYVPASARKVVLEDALSGLVAGLALGAAAVVVTELTSDRVRRRVDIAAALGTNVELSVGHMLNRRWLWGPRRRRQLTSSTSASRLIERRLRDHMQAIQSDRLCVVEVGAGPQAAVALTALGHSLSSEGKHVLLIDAADGRPVRTLLGAPAGVPQSVDVEANGQHMSLLVAPDHPVELASLQLPTDVDVTITLATVDPAIGADYLSSSERSVIVMVRSGAASTVYIRTVGNLLREALIDLRFAILIDADADDHTSGRLSPRVPDDPGDYSIDALRGVRP